MRRTRHAAVLLVLAMSLSGCTAVQSVVSSDKSTEVPVDHADIATVEAPDDSVVREAAVVEAARSVVKIRSTAPGCQKIFEGSGVVMAPNRVMSNAHVVAGASSFTVSADGQEYDATVVLFDPGLDISVLDVPGLAPPPLKFMEAAVPSGTDAVVMGYPGGGEFVATAARVREVIELSGPDIYQTATVQREVYVIRGEVGQGESGGPLVDRDGRVLGINFGAAVDDPNAGFVLTAKQVYSQMVLSIGQTQPVATGACVDP
jgi:S1-C subfamily serine protease